MANHKEWYDDYDPYDFLGSGAAYMTKEELIAYGKEIGMCNDEPASNQEEYDG